MRPPKVPLKELKNHRTWYRAFKTLYWCLSATYTYGTFSFVAVPDFASFQDRIFVRGGNCIGGCRPQTPAGSKRDPGPYFESLRSAFRQYGHAIWPGHMAGPYGRAIWQSHMAEPYGKAIWYGHRVSPPDERSDGKIGKYEFIYIYIYEKVDPSK